MATEKSTKAMLAQLIEKRKEQEQAEEQQRRERVLAEYTRQIEEIFGNENIMYRIAATCGNGKHVRIKFKPLTQTVTCGWVEDVFGDVQALQYAADGIMGEGVGSTAVLHSRHEIDLLIYFTEAEKALDRLGLELEAPCPCQRDGNDLRRPLA